MRAHLAVEAANGAVGPLIAVLVRAQVVLHQEADRLALVACEGEARVDLVEHARADFGVAVEVDTVGRERARRDFADVVEQRGPADERAADRLPDDLLRVRPDVFVLATGFLDEVDRRFQLGEEDAEDARLLHPLEGGVDVAAADCVFHRRAETGGVGVRKSDSMILRDARNLLRRRSAFVRDGARDLDENDGVDLDERADARCCSVRHACDFDKCGRDK